MAATSCSAPIFRSGKQNRSSSCKAPLKFPKRCAKRSWAPTRRAFWAWIFDQREKPNQSATRLAFEPPPLGGSRLRMPCPVRRHATVAGRLIEHGMARDLAGERRHVGILLHLEGIEAGAQQEDELVAQHVAGGAQLAAKAIRFPQLSGLAVGAAV